jgi:hypothetical protein
MITGALITVVGVFSATLALARAVPGANVSPMVLALGVSGLAFTVQHLFFHFGVQLSSIFFTLYLQLLVAPTLYALWATEADGGGGGGASRHVQLVCTSLLGYSAVQLFAHFSMHLASVAFALYAQLVVAPAVYVQWAGYSSGGAAGGPGAGGAAAAALAAAAAAAAAAAPSSGRARRRAASKSPAPPKR